MPTDTRLLLQTAIAPVAWGTTYIALSELLPPDRPLLAALGRALPAGLLLAALFRGLPRGDVVVEGAAPRDCSTSAGSSRCCSSRPTGCPAA